MKVKLLSRVRLCDTMDCSLSGFSIHGIFQARVLEWAAISFSSRSSWPRDQTRVSCIAGRCFTLWATREAPGRSSLSSNPDKEYSMEKLQWKQACHARCVEEWTGSGASYHETITEGETERLGFNRDQRSEGTHFLNYSVDFIHLPLETSRVAVSSRERQKFKGEWRWGRAWAEGMAVFYRADDQCLPGTSDHLHPFAQTLSFSSLMFFFTFLEIAIAHLLRF